VSDVVLERDAALGPLARTVVRRRGLAALATREVHRVLKLWSQTIAAPVVAAFLFILVFGSTASPTSSSSSPG
jgi:hypothetical protein